MLVLPCVILWLTFFHIYEQHFSIFLYGLQFLKATSPRWSPKFFYSVNLTLDLWLNMLKFTAYLNFFLSIVLPCYAAFLYCKPLLFDPCFPEAVSLIPILTSPVTCCILKGLPLFLSNEIITFFLFSHWRQDKCLFRPCNIRRNLAFSLSPQPKSIAERQYLRCFTFPFIWIWLIICYFLFPCCYFLPVKRKIYLYCNVLHDFAICSYPSPIVANQWW